MKERKIESEEGYTQSFRTWRSQNVGNENIFKSLVNQRFNLSSKKFQLLDRVFQYQGTLKSHRGNNGSQSTYKL
ncbi:unnamed protein product [Paramecium octaurelia]|uniref:Uncharacterized protein n=1 Tax=Paramecium octaurelia TaxID=43137 RepID=A0A8S1YK25_PAROT|nr:unnamed protein product [Paramecium octaurelia]